MPSWVITISFSFRFCHCSVFRKLQTIGLLSNQGSHVWILANCSQSFYLFPLFVVSYVNSVTIRRFVSILDSFTSLSFFPNSLVSLHARWRGAPTSSCRFYIYLRTIFPLLDSFLNPSSCCHVQRWAFIQKSDNKRAQFGRLYFDPALTHPILWIVFFFLILHHFFFTGLLNCLTAQHLTRLVKWVSYSLRARRSSLWWRHNSIGHSFLALIPTTMALINAMRDILLSFIVVLPTAKLELASYVTNVDFQSQSLRSST